MNVLFIAFYLMFLVGCLTASIFIVYHITRYSINKKSSTIMFLLFVSVLLLLLLLNISIFINLDLNESFNFISSFNLNESSF